jgi:hypothetical protein
MTNYYYWYYLVEKAERRKKVDYGLTMRRMGTGLWENEEVKKV